MGYVRVKGIIRNLTEKAKWAEVEFIADTGAMWTVVPKGILHKIDIKPTGEMRFRLANGEASNFPIGNAWIEIEGRSIPLSLAFGSENSPALLGVTTLEQLGLEVDPTTGKLKPMELMLL